MKNNAISIKSNKLEHFSCLTEWAAIETRIYIYNDSLDELDPKNVFVFQYTQKSFTYKLTTSLTKNMEIIFFVLIVLRF